MREATRKLRVGARTYFWRVRHAHGESGAPCTDLLSLRSDAPRSAPLFIAFTGGPGRAVGDGINPNGISGGPPGRQVRRVRSQSRG